MKKILIILFVIPFLEVFSCSPVPVSIKYEVSGTADQCRIEMGDNFEIIGVSTLPWSYNFNENYYNIPTGTLNLRATNISSFASNMILSIYVDDKLAVSETFDGMGVTGEISCELGDYYIAGQD
ncbi:MAG: hypothetical protein JW982_12905 [Spirochaetes bacterium]|nr:hypothetical protein [Spirochaetota bacterium]